MGISDILKQAVGIESEDDFDEATEEEITAAKEQIKKDKSSFSDTVHIPQSSRNSKQSERRYSVANTSALKLVLIEPKSFDECPRLVESLKSRRPVIINLENIEAETARKIFDFLNGAIYALNGNVQKIANNIFIFLPENVSVAGGEKQGFSFLAESDDHWNN